MNRRHFLAWLGGTAAGVALAPTLDLDKLLWMPGEKTIFVFPPIAETDWFESYSLADIQRRVNCWQSMMMELSIETMKFPPKSPWLFRA